MEVIYERSINVTETCNYRYQKLFVVVGKIIPLLTYAIYWFRYVILLPKTNNRIKL